RAGLGLGGRHGHPEQPWYVAAKDGERNALIVVQGHDHPLLSSSALTTGAWHWLSSPRREVFRCSVKVRYRQADQRALLEPRADIEALLEWDPAATPAHEIAFTPARVILQDFTGVPCVVDLAAMRDAIVRLGGDAERVNPLSPAELVIDHSVQVDEYGTAGALAANTAIEFSRNRERYSFLRWGQTAFRNFSVVPPNTGIVHQVNLEFLARVIFGTEAGGTRRAYPDTLVGTDSHTTMINGLGVLGWGVGGIEAEAAMLGQAVTMLIPQVI